uniref:Metallo-beta-lactamase domain-containing protein n=1 Tax=Panagrolaimus sp. PS1159 TaxID=55785 RepID=A0AC35GCC8_9BILA
MRNICLTKEGITLDEIETVVITHGHPGHMGNMNFFGQKPILFHSLEYIGRHVTPTELKERPYRKISNNIEVWKTPGHTQHDLSVLVHNVQGYGSMAVVGDLIPTEQFISDNIDAMSAEGAWDTAIKRQNANLIICMADWIIPGHGQPFRVLPQYRQKAGCTRLLAQRHILNARQ